MGFSIPPRVGWFWQTFQGCEEANHTWIKLGAKNHTNSHEITSRHQANWSKSGFAFPIAACQHFCVFFQTHFTREQQRSQQRVMNENENCWLTIHPINLSLTSNLSYSILYHLVVSAIVGVSAVRRFTPEFEIWGCWQSWKLLSTSLGTSVVCCFTSCRKNGTVLSFQIPRFAGGELGGS